jgi:hypothetical protein
MSDNYKAKIEELLRQGKIPAGPGLNHLIITHDEWCDKLKRQDLYCNCDPDIRVMTDAEFVEQYGPCQAPRTIH